MIIEVGIGVGLAALSVPLYMRWVPPNPIYGLRTAATSDDEWVWYEANAASGLDGVVGCAAIVALAAVLKLAGFSDETSARAVTIALAGVALALLIRGVRTANRLQRSRNSQSGEDSFKGENFP